MRCDFFLKIAAAIFAIMINRKKSQKSQKNGAKNRKNRCVNVNLYSVFRTKNRKAKSQIEKNRKAKSQIEKNRF